MARVTVEDCILHIPNRFELVLVAAQRAKQIASGNPLTIDRDNDKDAVVALREIAEETISLETLKEETLNSFSRRRAMEAPARIAPAREERDDEIKEAFDDAQSAAGMDELDEDEAGEAGLSFVEENMNVED